jgi:hypothetical protein
MRGENVTSVVSSLYVGPQVVDLYSGIPQGSPHDA